MSVPVHEFKFMDPFEEDLINGLCFNGVYLPQEIVIKIFNYIPPKKILELTLVCKLWCNIVKSQNFWMHIYNKRYPTKAKGLPWYVFYCYFTTNNFHNMIKNGNGQEGYNHWQIEKNYGNKFTIEDPPVGSDPLPLNVSDFNGCTSCFATSYRKCNKNQKIYLRNKRLLRYILNKFKPHIYASEWVAGRFDCGCTYKLVFRGYDEYSRARKRPRREHHYDPLFYLTATTRINQWEGREWQKMELLVKEYPPILSILIFEHEGSDTQFWRGHYGSKMAGGVVRVIFESIEPLEDKHEENVS